MRKSDEKESQKDKISDLSTRLAFIEGRTQAIMEVCKDFHEKIEILQQEISRLKDESAFEFREVKDKLRDVVEDLMA